MRSRYHRVALAADIEKAFPMVQIKEADLDVMRFLWIDDTDDENPNMVVKRSTELYLASQVLPSCWTQQSDTTRPSIKLMIPGSWAISDLSLCGD